MIRFLCPFVFLALALGGEAGVPPADQLAAMEQRRQLAEHLQYRSGKLLLPDHVATIDVGEQFRYLDQNDARTVLTKIWLNPPEFTTLALLFPTGQTPLDPDAWGVVVTYEKTGYVKDSEAKTLDYGKLLQTMKTGVQSANAAREQQGYPTIELIGWATPPHYDAATHKLFWAKELRFGGKEEGLNYCIRALGRHGVLELNAVATMEQLPEIEKATPALLQTVEFSPGERYTDFNASTDKVAEYGIAALIAGGIIAKTGLLKIILTAILAAKKFVIIGIIALWGTVKKFFAKFSPPKQRNLDV